MLDILGPSLLRTHRGCHSLAQDFGTGGMIKSDGMSAPLLRAIHTDGITIRLLK